MVWLVVNVILPVALPLFLLALAKTTRAGHGLRLMETVKDGQLCWFAITLSAASFYDLMQNDGSGARVQWCGTGMAGMAFLGVCSAVYAVVAAIQPTPVLTDPSKTLLAWASHYTVFLTSLGIALIDAIASLYIHTHLPAAQ